uniref:Uncharacterized protein n=1 Tax=Avena sativa TaxID=4498 RepID=A0ACD5U018_AVESA
MAPLNLVADDTLSDEDTRVAVVSKILSDHPGPTRHFSLDIISLPGFLAKVARWFRSETLTGLQELGITNRHNKQYHYQLLPRALTRFAPTLSLLELRCCRFHDRTALPSFPHLKRLSLYSVGISDDYLQRLISSSAVLESVRLRCVRFSRICISSRTLRSIKLLALLRKGELVIEDAPCLERLLQDFPDDGPTTIRVIQAPKLEILGFLSEGISTLQLGTSVFQKMIAVNLTTKMHTMKILALSSTGAKLGAAIDFLKCFPCLEKLYVVLQRGNGMDNSVNYDLLDPIDCLEFHLQKVVLKNYDGDRREFIDFATVFVLNAKVLKQMEIGVLNSVSDKWMCDLRRKLQVENRASRDAQIELKSDAYACPSSHEYTMDLSVADPFGSARFPF